jgi:hypothetical protein
MDVLILSLKFWQSSYRISGWLVSFIYIRGMLCMYLIPNGLAATKTMLTLLQYLTVECLDQQQNCRNTVFCVTVSRTAHRMKRMCRHVFKMYVYTFDKNVVAYPR